MTILATQVHFPAPTIAPSPSELHDAGYRDALNHRTNYRFYNKNSEYTRGHIAGYRARPGSLFNLDLPTQAPLERGWGDELLNPI